MFSLHLLSCLAAGPARRCLRHFGQITKAGALLATTSQFDGEPIHQAPAKLKGRVRFCRSANQVSTHTEEQTWLNKPIHPNGSPVGAAARAAFALSSPGIKAPVVGALVFLLLAAVDDADAAHGRAPHDRPWLFRPGRRADQYLFLHARRHRRPAGARQRLRYYFVITLGERVVSDIRRDVFDHVMKLSSSFFDAAMSGEIVSR
jgi:hypothetical protein